MRVHTNHHIAILLALGLTSLSVACSNSNPSADLQKEVKTIVSWIETARAVGEAWKNGSIPSAYAGRTFHTAQESLQQEIKTIQSLSIPDAAKITLSTQLQLVQTSIGQAALSIENNDRPAFEKSLTELTTARQSLSPSTK